MKRRLFQNLIILSLFLFVNSFAAIVTDNDKSVYVTKSEFDALKNDFKNQINAYNNKIDIKIDGAIDSYLANYKLTSKTELKNYYSDFKCGEKFKWGNNLSTSGTSPIGGCNVKMYVVDTQSTCKSNFNYSSTWDNIVFFGDKDKNKISLDLYKYDLMLYEADSHHFYQNATRLYGDRTWISPGQQSAGTSSVKPKRDSLIQYYCRPSYGPLGQAIEAHLWTVYVTENKTLDTTSIATLSMNNTGLEYYIDDNGDLDKGITVTNTYKVPTSTGWTGNWAINEGQSTPNKWTADWAKSYQHNFLRIDNFEYITGKEEQIISGAPAAYIDKNESDIEVKYKADVTGTFYVYASENPIRYTNLSDNSKTKIVNVSEVNKTKSIKLENCSQGEWLRVGFIPSNNLGTLTIESIIQETK